MSTYERWKLLLTALASLLAPIAIPPLVVAGSVISIKMGHMPGWLVMAGITLPMLMTIVSCIAMVRLIRMLRPSLPGGKRTYTGRYKNLE